MEASATTLTYNRCIIADHFVTLSGFPNDTICEFVRDAVVAGLHLLQFFLS